MGEIRAVISDFGGVLTSPLRDSFAAFTRLTGISMESLGAAMAADARQRGANPLFELECGRLSESDFLAALGAQLTAAHGREITLDGFGERYFAALKPNEPFIAYLRELRERGYRMALCTNNVREWAPLWRAMAPVEEIFEVVVDSSEVGTRKPDPEIYEATLRELGVPAAQALFIDDIEINCDAARTLGMAAVRFETTEQARADAEAALRRGGGDAG